MSRALARPPEGFPPTPVPFKLKAIEILPPLGGFWPDLWNAGWSATLIANQVGQIAALGANAIKVTGSAAAEGGHPYPDEATYRARRRTFLQRCRDDGLGVYWTLGNGPMSLWGADGTRGEAAITGITALAATLQADGGDVLLAFDLCNEFNLNPPSTWGPRNAGVTARCAADMAALTAAVRAATDVPLSASVCVTSPGAFGAGANAHIDLQHDLGLDFHDVHPYYQDRTYDPRGPIPASRDLDALEGRGKYLGRHLIGEMGCAATAGTALQTVWFDRIGDIARRPQSLGAVLFGLSDFETTYRYGIYADTDATFSRPRPGLAIPFASWPSGS